jgi:hypothetical protein
MPVAAVARAISTGAVRGGAMAISIAGVGTGACIDACIGVATGAEAGAVACTPGACAPALLPVWLVALAFSDSLRLELA